MQISKSKFIKNRFIRIETTNQGMLNAIKERGFRSYMLAILKDGVSPNNITDKDNVVKAELAINRAGVLSNGIGFSPNTDIIVKPTMADYFEMEKILKQHKRRST
jgi:hypothetical protein